MHDAYHEQPLLTIMRIVWLAIATGAAAACRPAACAAAAQRRICGMWPKPGTRGCDGLLRVPLAVVAAARATRATHCNVAE